MSDVVGKLWGFCHTLRHDGIDYGDYIEQLTYLLFLKMADEKGADIPNEYSWRVLREKSGTELTEFYVDALRGLGKQKGTLGDIYGGAISKFSNPVNLKRLINLIDEIEWTSLNVDVKAAAYEGLLEKSASEGKKGAGQYFTPRVLIQSIVKCMKPDPRKTKDFVIHDPAAGTGGFLVCAYEWLMEQTKGSLERDDAKRITSKVYTGTELVARPRRLALMNLYLHGIHADIYLGDSIYEPMKSIRYDCILTNPPFGTKGARQVPTRDDFSVETSNKQLNFVQHVVNILKAGGRAAVVLPDGVLSSGNKVFKLLMEDCDLHTILRLPTGTFTPYSQGVKANVIFFTKGKSTENIWIYDARTNIPKITKKSRPLMPDHFKEFELSYGENPNGLSKRVEGERFKRFHISEIKSRNFDIDIFWLKDVSIEEEFEPPEIIIKAVTEVETRIHKVIQEITEVVERIEVNSNGWELKEMKDVATVIMGQSPPSKTYNTKGEGLPFYQGKKEFGEVSPTAKYWCSKPSKIAEKDDILLSVRAPVGHINIANEKCCIGRGLAALRPKKILDKDYFYHYMKFVSIKLMSAGRGSTFNAIKRSDVDKIKVSYPKLIEDQKKMVLRIRGILRHSSDISAQSDALGKNLLRFQKSVLTKLFKQD